MIVSSTPWNWPNDKRSSLTTLPSRWDMGVTSPSCIRSNLLPYSELTPPLCDPLGFARYSYTPTSSCCIRIGFLTNLHSVLHTLYVSPIRYWRLETRIFLFLPVLYRTRHSIPRSPSTRSLKSFEMFVLRVIRPYERIGLVVLRCIPLIGSHHSYFKVSLTVLLYV